MQTIENISSQIIDELYNSMFDNKTKEYLDFLGVKCTDSGIEFPLSGTSLIMEKACELEDNFGEKIEKTKNPSVLFKEDEYTGTVINFPPQYVAILRMTFLNKNIVYLRKNREDNKVLNMAEHQKVGDIDVIRFTDYTDDIRYETDTTYTLFIKPQKPIICHASYGKYSKYMIIMKPTEHDSNKKIYCKVDDYSKCFGIFDETNIKENNFYIIRTRHNDIECRAEGTLCSILLPKIDKTYLGSSIKLLRNVLATQYRKYIAEIFTAPNIAQKVFGDFVPLNETDYSKVKYRLMGKCIIDENDVEIIRLDREPGSESSRYLSMDINYKPHLAHDISVEGTIDTKKKGIEISIEMPMGTDKKSNKVYVYRFEFLLDNPKILTSEELFIKGGDLNYQIDKNNTVSIHCSRFFFEREYEKELFKDVIKRFSKLSTDIKEELNTDTYSL